MVFNGVRSFGNVSTGGLEVCGLVSCAGDSIADCGTLYPDPSAVVLATTFESLTIRRQSDIHLQLSSRSFLAPSTLTLSQMQPMVGDGDFVYLANSSLVQMALARPSSDVVTFAIYGRRFDRDGQEETRATGEETSSLMLIITILIFVLVKTMIYQYWKRRMIHTEMQAEMRRRIGVELRAEPSAEN